MELQLNNIKIKYQEFGTGQPLVYVPMLSGEGRTFYKQAVDLQEDFHTVYYNLRETSDMSYDLLTKDLLGLLDHLGFERPIIVGESFGGTIAMSFALKHPKRVSKLVISSSFARYPRPSWLKLGIFLMNFCPKTSIRWYLNGKWAKILKNCQADHQDAPPSRGDTSPAKVFRARMRLISKFDVLSRLSEIECPVLFIGGKRDWLMNSGKECLLMSENTPNGQAHIINGAGHMSMIDAPKEWLSAFRKFAGQG